MSRGYTKLQREADELDLDMYRLIDRLRAFADRVPHAHEPKLHNAALALSIARGPVRAQMHPQRREETSHA